MGYRRLICCLACFITVSLFATDAKVAETTLELGNQNTYLTYVLAATLADGFSEGLYTAEECNLLLESYLALTDRAENDLEGCKPFFSAEKQKTINELLKTYLLLINEMTALKNYINTGKKENLDSYDKFKTQAWDLIEKNVSFDSEGRKE